MYVVPGLYVNDQDSWPHYWVTPGATSINSTNPLILAKLDGLSWLTIDLGGARAIWYKVHIKPFNLSGFYLRTHI